jgi:hypothetical protein
MSPLNLSLSEKKFLQMQRKSIYCKKNQPFAVYRKSPSAWDLGKIVCEAMTQRRTEASIHQFIIFVRELASQKQLSRKFLVSKLPREMCMNRSPVPLASQEEVN